MRVVHRVDDAAVKTHDGVSLSETSPRRRRVFLHADDDNGTAIGDLMEASEAIGKRDILCGNAYPAMRASSGTCL